MGSFENDSRAQPKGSSFTSQNDAFLFDAGKQDANRSEILARILKLLHEAEDEIKVNQTRDICTFYHETKMWFEISTMALAIVCSLVLTISYSIIVKKVIDSGVFSGKRSTRKTMLTTAMLLGAFMIWYEICKNPILFPHFFLL